MNPKPGDRDQMYVPDKPSRSETRDINFGLKTGLNRDVGV